MGLTKVEQIRLLLLQAKKDGVLNEFINCSLIKDYYKVACEKDLTKYKKFLETQNLKGDLE